MAWLGPAGSGLGHAVRRRRSWLGSWTQRRRPISPLRVGGGMADGRYPKVAVSLPCSDDSRENTTHLVAVLGMPTGSSLLSRCAVSAQGLRRTTSGGTIHSFDESPECIRYVHVHGDSG